MEDPALLPGLEDAPLDVGRDVAGGRFELFTARGVHDGKSMEAPRSFGLTGEGGCGAPHAAREAELHRLRLGVAGGHEEGLRGEQVRARLELARVDREGERLRVLR